MKRPVIALGIAAAAALVAGASIWAWLQLAPRRAPAGQAALATLSPAALDEFRRDFDAAADGVRLLLLLSPT